MRIALAQYSMVTDMAVNCGKALGFIVESQRAGAQLIVFPELCLSPFFPQYAARDMTRYALSIDHSCIRDFQDTCRRLKVAASPNMYLREGNSLFDASILIGTNGELQGVSKMVHIAQVPGFYEQDYYTPSDTGFRVYDTPWGKVGIVVCFDRHFPESIRTCVLRGAQLIIVPTANTTDEPRDLFEYEMRVAAMQNGVFIAMCNRVGNEGEALFCGESIVVDPEGSVVVKSGGNEELILADVDFSRVEIARRNRPYLALWRPEMYERYFTKALQAMSNSCVRRQGP